MPTVCDASLVSVTVVFRDLREIRFAGHGSLLRWRRNREHLTPFFSYPADIRKVIYTTHAIESLNMSLRKVIKTRGSFPNADAAMKLLFLALEHIAKKWTMPVRDWKAALQRFAISARRPSPAGRAVAAKRKHGRLRFLGVEHSEPHEEVKSLIPARLTIRAPEVPLECGFGVFSFTAHLLPSFDPTRYRSTSERYGIL